MFDELLSELLETRLRYEILRGKGNSADEAASARSRLHELRADIARVRREN